MPYRKWLIYSIVMLALIQAASGIQVTCSGGSTTSESGLVATQIEAVKDASVLNEIAITGDGIKPFTSIRGPVGTFSQTHQVTDKSGKTAKVTVNVVNALRGIDYKSEVLPQEGTLTTIEPQVSAEQWLTVPRADSIRCLATASYKTLSADAGIEEISTRSTGHYATLTGYDCKATASTADVTAYQTAASGTGGSIKIYGHAKDDSGIFGVETQLPLTSNLVPFTSNVGAGFADQDVSFKDLNAMSSAGTSTGVTQNEHVVGKFISSAKAGTKTTSRISNYGDQYDLIMSAARGSQPTGALGYYVNPGMVNGATGALQGAVNAAKSGDIINAAAGEYNEDVNINKPLTLKGDGTGPTTATSFELTNGATLGRSSGGITAPLAIVNPYSKITDGLLLSSKDVHVNGNGGSYVYGDQLDQSALGSNIILTGFNNALTNSISINQPVAGKISGIKANTVNILNNGAKIKDGISLTSTGGTVNVGSGTFYENINIDKSLTVNGNGIANTIVNGNGAGSVFSIDGSATAAISNLKITNGRAFNGAGISNAGFLTLSNIELFGNTATQEGGGIYNSNTGTVALQDATISGNTAPSGPDIASYGNVVLNSAFSTLPGSYSTTVTVNNGAKILDGISLASLGGQVDVAAGSYDDNLDQSFYGKGVTLTGSGNTVTDSISLDRPVAGQIKGITANTINILSNNAKIQDGVTLASYGGIVDVAADTYYENVQIDKSLSVIGDGSTNTIVDGQQMGSVFTINNPSATVSLSGLKITNGQAAKGGGINNQAGLLTLTDIEVSGNDALDPGDGFGGGGGIYNSGSITIYGGIIRDNTASHLYNGGGGILNWYDSIMNLYGTTITGNSCNNGGGIKNAGTVNMYEGSSVASNYGGGIGNNGILNMYDSSVTGHSGEFSGTGIGNSGTVNMYSGSSVTGNDAVLKGGGIGNYGTVNMYSGSSISGNSAGSYGGGIYNSLGGNSMGIVNMYSGSSIFSNYACCGGGIFNDYGTINMHDGSSIFGNSASIGGGIRNSYTVNMYSGSSIFGNSASIGGGIRNSGTVNMYSGSSIASNSVDMYGAGIYNYKTGTVTFKDSVDDIIATWPGYDIGADPYGFFTPHNTRFDGTIDDIRDWQSGDV